MTQTERSLWQRGLTAAARVGLVLLVGPAGNRLGFPQPASSVSASADSAPEAAEDRDSGQGLVAEFGSVVASFKFFGDVGSQYSSIPSGDSSRSSFTAGSLVFFSSVHLDEHLQILSEVVAEFDADTNEVGFEMERLWGSYVLNDRFYLKLGREHSPVSRWNRHYHHGRLLWPAATQPFLARFEDQGGPLPVHQVGAEVGGKLQTGAGEFSYIAVVSNGRGLERTEVTNLRDHNSSKAWDVGGSYSPSGLPGFVIGADYHRDEIPPRPAPDPSTPEARETITTVFSELRLGSFETIAEFAQIRHERDSPETVFNHRSGYLQASYQSGKFTPYARIDLRSMDGGDPFFLDDDLDLDRWEGLAGIRHELGDNGAVKFEVGYGRGENRDDAGLVRRRGFTSAALQLAWGF